VAVRRQAIGQFRRETLDHVERAPGPIECVARRPAKERRVEEHHVEALARDRREEIALPHVDAIFHLVQQHVDARAADSGRVDIDRHDALANAALDLFIEIYGAHAGDLALTVGASGGVYVAGGIAAKILPRLREGQFLRAFNDKGRMRRLTEAMPVSVVTADTVGLIGAALVAGRLT